MDAAQRREVTVKEQYKVMAAMLALREFTTADLARFSGVTDSTIRTILNRHRGAYEEVAHAAPPGNRDRGGQFKTLRLKPEATTEFRQQLKELQDIVGRAVTPGLAARDAATLPPSTGTDMTTERLREPVELVVARDLLLRRIPEAEPSLRSHLLYDADLALRAARRILRSCPSPGGDVFRLALDALVAAQNYLSPKPNEERCTVESLLDFAGRLSILGQKQISTELIGFATNALAERLSELPETAESEQLEQTVAIETFEAQSEPPIAVVANCSLESTKVFDRFCNLVEQVSADFVKVDLESRSSAELADVSLGYRDWIVYITLDSGHGQVATVVAEAKQTLKKQCHASKAPMKCVVLDSGLNPQAVTAAGFQYFPKVDSWDAASLSAVLAAPFSTGAMSAGRSRHAF